MGSGKMKRNSSFMDKALAGTVALTVLAGCQDFQGFNIGKNAEETSPAGATSTTVVERDVEAPEVFYASEAGLWDGRPSLGGVWAAHPDVSDPERVIIKNKANGKFVIGALFRRERAIPGPRVQLSSDAANALSVLAGQPVEIEVTALRREETPVVPEVDTVAPVETVSEETLDPIASAGAAIDNAEAQAAAPAPQPKPVSSLAKPFVQIGIFSIENNAKNAANQMRSAGMIPTVKAQTIKGKPFWRVVVGPATTRGELNDLIKRIRSNGFTDAYAVSN
jgi:hypothetical protein